MKVLLLGASGLLGHNVLRRLVADGHDVRIVVRRPDAVTLEPQKWETIVGSVLDADTLSSAAKGCDAIVNCAGTTDMSLRRLEDYLPVNRDLCQMILEAMDCHGISTLVHTSTVNTIGNGSADHPADESVPMSMPCIGSFYADSKRIGEELILSASKAHPERHIVVINPGFMIGAYDAKPSSGRLLLAGYRRRLMAAPKGGKAFVAVDDVAEAITAALTHGTSGSRYIVVNDKGCLTFKQLYTLQAATIGYRQTVVELPNWILGLAGRFGDLLRVCGVKTELSFKNVSLLMMHEYYTCRNGKSALGFKTMPIEEAMQDLHKWNETRKTEIK